MRLPFPAGLRSRIALLILLGVLPAFFLVCSLAVIERRDAIEKTYQNTNRLARLAAAKEGALIEGARQLTLALSVMPTVVRHDAASCNLFAEKLLAGYPEYTNFGVVNLDGTIWCSSAPLRSRPNLRDRSYVRQVIEQHKPALGGFQIGRVTGLPSIVYAGPIGSAGRVEGVAFASLRISAFGALGGEVEVPEGASYLIVDHYGKVMRRFPETGGWEGRDIAATALFREASGRSHGSMHAADVDGLPRLYGFAWTGSDIAHSVLVAVGVPQAVAVRPANRHLLLSLTTLLLVTALTIGLAVAASRALILAPVNRLLLATRRIASGELAFRTHMVQQSELGELGRAVDEMAASLDKQQQTLREGEARFRDLTELSSDWYWEQDEALRFSFLSRDIAQSGDLASSTLGKRLWELPEADLRSADFAGHRTLCEAQRSFRDFIYRRVNASGKEQWLALSGQPIFDQTGRFRGYRGVGREVTEQKHAELGLTQAKVFLDALINAIPSPVLVKDQQHRYIAANAAFTVFFQRGLDEVLGKTDLDFFSAEDAAFYQASDTEALEEGRVVEYERAYTIKATTHWMRVRKCRLIAPDESPFVVLLLTDVTERRATELALRQSEARFRSLTELSADWYWEQDDQFRFTFISAEADTNSRYAASGTLGVTRWGHSAVDQGSADWEAHQASCRAHQPFRDFVYRRIEPDGSSHWLAVSGEPLFDADSRFLGYRGVGRDITQQKRVEQEIIRHKDLYAALSQTNRAIVHIREPQALFDEVCRVAAEHGHFCLVWIGLLDAATGWVRTMSVDGPASRGYPSIRVSIDPAVPEGRGFAGAAMREGRYYVVNDYFAEPRVAPWVEQARAAGIRSMANFPLKCDGRTVGVLNLYGSEVDFFSPELVELLHEMAENIGFALTNMRRETERTNAARALAQSEQRFRHLASNIPEVFWITEPAYERVIYVSPAYEQVWGRSTQRLIENPRDWLEAVHEDDRNRVAAALRSDDGPHIDHEYRIVRPDNSVRWIHDRAFPIFDEAGRLTMITGIAEDITARKLAEERLVFLAHYDNLTGLPNRPLFYDRLQQALAHCRRNHRAAAVVFADLDHFKVVNDTLGHAAGDHLLKQVSQRLLQALRADDTVCRLGGDEFAVILSDLAHGDDAGPAVQKLMHALEQPFELEGREIFVTASAGVTLFPSDGEDADTLLKNADTAMYRAKELGRTSHQFFRAEMNARSVERMALESSLRRALERDEFVLHYQPKVDFASGRITGVEALLRWQHPELGLVPPARFISILEDNGLIVPVGEWVLSQACRQLAQWRARGFDALGVSVNLSGRQLQEPHVERSIKRIVAVEGIDPRLIELEITESVLMRNPEQAAHILRALKGSGMRLSVDDFGTGYSSLSYLRSFPLDALKIDRSFVKDLITRADDAAIVKAIVALAQSLRLRTIAEGVEESEQYALLTSLGCDEYQGYYFSRPRPADEIAVLVEEAIAAQV
jgi:diguanylate cyclase (GGDEF)-like protein/PAS domain S-box-containing protein